MLDIDAQGGCHIDLSKEKYRERFITISIRRAFAVTHPYVHLISHSPIYDLSPVHNLETTELVDKRNVLLLGLLWGDAIVVDLLPRLVLGLALEVKGSWCWGVLKLWVLESLLVECVELLSCVLDSSC